ncbi:MAG: fused MFS/spermidine synthase [Fimbriimonadaceae bacterium]
MRLLYTLAIFLGSALLFLVQPMVAKMVLPTFGGTPAVWNTSVVFFQTVLLLGYLYAHLSTRWLGVRRQAAVHLGILALVALALPIAMPSDFRPAELPVPPPVALLFVLATAVGLPFFAVSAGAPLLQRWFSETSDRRAKDPYFLYAASNAGSLLALLAYPFLLEPALRLTEQSRLWALGYGALFLLAAASAVGLWRSAPAAGSPTESEARVADEDADAPADRPVTNRSRARWLILSAVPASLLLGVTGFLSSNIAAMPLLWVVPLALYLLTYIGAFSRRRIPAYWLGRAVAILAIPTAIITILESSEPFLAVAIIHLATFTVGSLMCHTRLSESRPPTRFLTEFYLYISLGGLLGGAFTALVAPAVFNIIAEYPIALVALLLLRPAREPGLRRWDLVYPAVVAAASSLLPWLFNNYGQTVASVAGTIGIPGSAARIGMLIGLPLLMAFFAIDRPLRYGLSIAVVFVVALMSGVHLSGNLLLTERSFFGVHRVVVNRANNWHEFVHGNTVHGRQSLDPELARIPMTYYHPTGPIGQVFLSLEGERRPERVALIGLGTGALSAYGHPGQLFNFYEIDPTVIRVANDRRFFTYTTDSKADVRFVLGDARLMLELAEDASYDLIVLDAFSSDSIPAHLITRQAFELYLDKLRPGGMIAVHISNRFLELNDPIAYAARDLGLAGLSQTDVYISSQEMLEGKNGSTWVVLAREPDTLQILKRTNRWDALEPFFPGRAWTDDFSNILQALIHKKRG